MDPGSLVRSGLLLIISICVCVVSGNPLYTTVIDCTTDSSKAFGPVDEGYAGEVEVVTGIAAGSGVKLVPYIFDKHLEYLELSFTLGDTSATVRTKKLLDADTLTDSGGFLFYSIMCDGVIKHNNTRRLRISDINDNSPIFEEKLYSQNVSESEPVGFEIVRVRATDADSTAANNAITYSLAEPASEVFEVTSAGAVRLKKRLNYNSVQQYNFIVRASDPLGLSDTATVVINVEDYDNLNPYFSHSLYQAFIPENQVTVGTVSSEVVVIRLNQPVNTVENKSADMERSLSNALGWTANVSKVSPITNRRASESRIQRAAMLTRVSFICLDGGRVVSGEEVTMKLQSQSEAVRAELVKVFGDSLQFEIESEPQGPASNQAVVIAVSVLVPLIVIVLIVVVLVRRGSIRRLIGL